MVKEKITRGEIAWGGYAPTAAFIANLQSGRKIFIKGTHPGQDTHGTQMLRQEIEAYETISGMSEISPAYLGYVSDNDEDGWMLGVFEYIDVVPTLPWTKDKIEKSLQLLSRLHKTEAPPSLPAAKEKNFIEKFLKAEGGWLRFQKEKHTAEKFLTLFDDGDAGRAWLEKSLPVFCAYQSKAASMGGPLGVLHGDLRSDNVLFDRTSRPYLIDWPNACHGPVVLDVVGFLSGVASESNFDPDQLLKVYETASGIILEREDITVALSSLSGHMADAAYRAIPPKLPRLRWLQKTILWAQLLWAVKLMKGPEPPKFRDFIG